MQIPDTEVRNVTSEESSREEGRGVTGLTHQRTPDLSI